ncbi:MAG: PLP-dependent aminotransferase family protein [Desulfobacula sp.]|uniref:aminotransferase-like domain-containing protein n=2 Tax=Desulfobacula sp. TaxID=2593537 RepID=UPI001D69B17F|nr:PLP-dependent aminotransferase family protein [Desulfobacula sp.]MBT3807053.1 PLP-dependent aminotransferase family protein [Desulfobacula sp.]MBT4201275.1 PLP-dependent aminotransferase family protein [Desulfobacula sp.]MBT5973653.1 PLP-dependent aminotransferase family protein [Desulfobacula sp.]MBT7051956.1 PLP-dependent aminotransferase family protein [Desulfobacula sp.]
MDSNQTLPQIDLPRDMIHLGIGQPSNHLLPIKELEKAAAHCLSKENSFFLAYGEERGNANFRQTLAKFLTGQYPNRVDPEQLLITNGNSQALDFICTLFTKPGDTVLVEEPSYFLALRIFADRKLNLVSIPVDDNGLVTDVLRKKLETLKPSFLYTIPTYHNPASVTLPLKRRENLVEICAQNDLLVVADEVYHFLNYSDDPPPPMGNWTGTCPLISLGSFSKILAPGLRLGWMHTNVGLIKKMTKSGLIDSGGGFNPFTSEIVNSFICLGFLKVHIKHLKTVYGQRIKVFCDQLRMHLPKQAKFKIPKGGYFIWVKLPDNMDTKSLRQEARKHNVDFHQGSLFSHNKELKNYLRLAFALYDEDVLAEGARRLGKVILENLS